MKTTQRLKTTLQLTLLSLTPLILHAGDSNPQNDIKKISKSFGHIIGQNLETLGLDFDIKEVLLGIEESQTGKTSPMSETDCIQAISTIQEANFQKSAESNLKQAEKFLASNKAKEGVVEIEEGKLQYITVQQGEGDAVTANNTPLIRYIGKYIDGKIFGESAEEETIDLSETLPGFSKGIIGMKEGEKREIFIHPDLGYGSTGYLAPNSLLKFEIECIKTNSKIEDTNPTLTTKHEGEEIEMNQSEIALPDKLQEITIR